MVVRVCAADVWGLVIGSVYAQLWVVLLVGVAPLFVLVTSLLGYLGTV